MDRMKVERIGGVGIMVKDLEEASKFFADLLGTEFSGPFERGEVRTLESPLGITLLTPLSPDGPVAKTIERRGEGLYFIALGVQNLKEAVAEIKSKGIRQITEGPAQAFFHPGDSHGVMIELVE